MNLSSDWDYIQDVAKRRIARNRTKWQVYDENDKTRLEVLGAAGELAARRYFGISEYLHVGFDGGVDLVHDGVRVDVKTIHIPEWRSLLEKSCLQIPIGKTVNADVIMVIGVILEDKYAQEIGYATRDEILGAPENYERKIACREINIADLHPFWELCLRGLSDAERRDADQGQEGEEVRPPVDGGDHNVGTGSFSRNSRIVDRRCLRWVVNERDGCCMIGLRTKGRYGGCSSGLDPHHIINRGAGGDDVQENLITLCRKHHNLAQNRTIKKEELYDILESSYPYLRDRLRQARQRHT